MKISALTDDVFARLYNAGHPVLLRGAAGIAKTASVMQAAPRLGLELVIEFLPAQDAPDAMGFLIPSKTDQGPVANYAKPNWLRRIEETGKAQGILFLDEFLAADHLVQKAYAPLLSERKIGQWELPAGWQVWMSGNRVTDKAGANRMLGHVGNRMSILDVSPDVDGWLKWANNNGMHPMYTAFAKARPGIVFNEDPPKDPNEPRCSPRSFTFAADFHTQGVEGMELPSDGVTQEIVQGYIGEGAAAEFFSFIKMVNELPTIEQIKKNPAQAKLPASERLDAQYAAVQMVIHHADTDNVDTLFQYIERLNKELQTSAAKQMIDKSGGRLLNSPALAKWISKNKALITATLA